MDGVQMTPLILQQQIIAMAGACIFTILNKMLPNH